MQQPEVDVAATVNGDMQRALFMLQEDNKAIRKDRQSLLIEAEAWRRLLREYGSHRPHCAINVGYGFPCSCGFARVTAQGYVPSVTDTSDSMRP